MNRIALKEVTPLNPTFTDYVRLIYTLFEEFERQRISSHRGRPFAYPQKLLIVFFTIMHFRRIFCFKAQHRWPCEIHYFTGLAGKP